MQRKVIVILIILVGLLLVVGLKAIVLRDSYASLSCNIIYLDLHKEELLENNEGHKPKLYVAYDVAALRKGLYPILVLNASFSDITAILGLEPDYVVVPQVRDLAGVVVSRLNGSSYLIVSVPHIDDNKLIRLCYLINKLEQTLNTNNEVLEGFAVLSGKSATLVVVQVKVIENPEVKGVEAINAARPPWLAWVAFSVATIQWGESYDFLVKTANGVLVDYWPSTMYRGPYPCIPRDFEPAILHDRSDYSLELAGWKVIPPEKTAFWGFCVETLHAPSPSNHVITINIEIGTPDGIVLLKVDIEGERS